MFPKPDTPMTIMVKWPLLRAKYPVTWATLSRFCAGVFWPHDCASVTMYTSKSTPDHCQVTIHCKEGYMQGEFTLWPEMLLRFLDTYELSMAPVRVREDLYTVQSELEQFTFRYCPMCTSWEEALWEGIYASFEELEKRLKIAPALNKN